VYSLHRLLKKTLEKTVDSRFEEKLEKVKQGLRLEEKKQSIVYEQQKDSFRRALMAMHTAEQMLSNSCEIATSVFSKYATASILEGVAPEASKQASLVHASTCRLGSNARAATGDGRNFVRRRRLEI